MNEAEQSTGLLPESHALSTGGRTDRWINYAKKVVPKQVSRRLYQAKDQVTIARLKYRSIAKEELINDIKSALAAHRGYAAAKIGESQKHWMYYEILLSQRINPAAVREFEEKLKFHCLKQEGLFPERCDFYLEFSRFYMKHVKNLDCLGLFYRSPSMEMELIKYYQLKNKFIHFVLQEPDLSSPSNDRKCYLPYFKDKKLLLICPFGDLLKERATKEIFEGVWSKTGKKWFYPQAVDSVEFPYGFAQETHEKYPTVLDLFEFIMGKISSKDFDVALIAAGGLSIPLASTIKNMGKVSIDLGGHLQFLFGVIGKRWRNREENKRDYFNEWWIDMPVKYKPKETDVCDAGAYW